MRRLRARAARWARRVRRPRRRRRRPVARRSSAPSTLASRPPPRCCVIRCVAAPSCAAERRCAVARGSGNVFAQEMSISNNIDEAAKLVLTGRVHDVDAGQVGDRYYLWMLGIGIEAKIAYFVNPTIKKYFGRRAPSASVRAHCALQRARWTSPPRDGRPCAHACGRSAARRRCTWPPPAAT